MPFKPKPCCQPFGATVCGATRDLRLISDKNAEQWGYLSAKIVAGERLCRGCRDHIYYLIRPPALDPEKQTEKSASLATFPSVEQPSTSGKSEKSQTVSFGFPSFLQPMQQVPPQSTTENVEAGNVSTRRESADIFADVGLDFGTPPPTLSTPSDAFEKSPDLFSMELRSEAMTKNVETISSVSARRESKDMFADISGELVHSDFMPPQSVQCVAGGGQSLVSESQETSTEDESVPSSQDVFTPSEWCDKIVQIYKYLGLNPPEKKKLKQQIDCSQYSITLQSAIKQYFVNASKISPKFTKKPFQGDFDFQDVCYEMITPIQEKLKEKLSIEKKIQLLSVLPQSWSTRFISSNFNVGQKIVNHTKLLVSEQGILPTVAPKKGSRVLDSGTINLVKQFYYSPDVSREMPGQRDVKSVRENGQRLLKQKRLFLSNLREGFALFQQENPAVKISFSKFAELRPAEVVLAGASGTHSVCVCQTHENVKLMFSAAELEDISDVRDREEGGVAPSMGYKTCLARIKCNPPSAACHFQECQSCPGPESLREDLELIFNERMVEKIEYRQWTNTDRSTLETKIVECEDFIDLVLEELAPLSVHDHIAKAQANYLKERKANLKPNEMIIVGDFSQNYSFIVQDAVQGFHWNNDQCTVHPFAGYCRPNINEEVKPFNFVILSDYLKHNTYAVYAFQRKLIEFIKSNYPQVEHIVYFSDGCAGQYKNRFNVSNLVNHFEDFGLTAEWHFFATSHGKGPSDGLGGALKRAAARASLRKVGFEKITTPKELFCFCKENLPGMNIEFVLIEEIQKSIDFLEDRFKRAAKVTNIMKIHKIVPVDKTTIEVARESSWSQSYIIKLKEEKQKGPSGKGSGGEGSLQPAHQSSVSTVTKRKSSSHEPNPKRKK